jgi:UDP-glucuronate 4-epimerase
MRLNPKSEIRNPKSPGTVLVTGAAGFIGWRTADSLLRQGFEVVGIDNLNDYYSVSLKRYRLRELEHCANFTFREADIEKKEDMDRIFRGHAIDAVIHLAARAGVRYSVQNPHVYVSTNVQGTLNLLELMREYRVTKVVLASSSSLYAGQKMPFSEDLPVNLPLSPYAASKKAAEMLAYTYHHLYGIDVSVLRYFTVYGPAGRPDMSPFRFIKWIDEGTELIVYGDGSQTRDFTYVDDIADGTIKALKSVGFEVINLGENRPHALGQLIRLIELRLKKKAKVAYHPFQGSDMKETWADITKAGNVLGWRPKVSFAEGIKRTIEWHIENRELVHQIEINLSV